MNYDKIGKLIYKLRTERNLTQKTLADRLNITNKTVSKWERGQGCPDVSLLGELSSIFGVEIEKILIGDLHPNEKESGNMKQLKFYTCSACGNVLTGIGNASISCCGRILEPLHAQQAEGEHGIQADIFDDEYYISLQHDMSKEHYISFAALISLDNLLIKKLYPEQNAQFYMPKLRRHTELYVYCTKHGLFKTSIKGTTKSQT